MSAKPNTGKYSLCSNNASLIGIMLDSTERVMKNQKMPIEIMDRFFTSFIPRAARPVKNRKANGVYASKKPLLKTYM